MRKLGQCEIGQLNNVVLADEDVRGAQVAVDVVLLLEVLHPFADLREHIDHDDRCNPRTHSLIAQISDQRAVAHVLGEHADWRLAGAHAEQLHELRVREPVHQLHLLEHDFCRHQSVLLEEPHRHVHAVAQLRVPELAERAGAELAAHDERRALHLELLEIRGWPILARSRRRQLAAQAVGALFLVRDERAKRAERGVRANIVAACLVQCCDLIVLHDRDAAALLVLVADAEREFAGIAFARSYEVSAAPIAR